MQVVRVSGTIKKAEEEAIRRARAEIMRAKREGGTDGLLGILGKEDDDGEGLKGGGRMTAGSDVSDEDDEVGTESEEDG